MSDGSPRGIGGEYGAVRANIDIERLNAYLLAYVPAVSSPVDVQQFKFGQSNPTYFLTDARRKRFVLRKKPAGQLLSSTAHQIEREYRMLSALHKHNTKPSTKIWQAVPVPVPYVLCEDVNVIGTPFYIMEYLDGRIFTDTRMLEVSPNDRRECWISAVQALAALASLDPADIGLANFGPSTDYFPRQIKSLTRVSQVQSQLADLGNLTQPWAIDSKHLPDDPQLRNYDLLKAFKNTTKDVPIPLQDLEREYCRLTNQAYPIKEMTFVRSWMLFRLAVISQGIAARFARRQASSERAHIHVWLFPAVGHLAKASLEDDGHIIDNKSKL
ncbi:protein kinase subdomain-containing protein PKL/CAK/ACAD [Chiua virens]|nr:protein kinase subdomain-containing protein PKL/CAK/ACAD [Chiua virens]